VHLVEHEEELEQPKLPELFGAIEVCDALGVSTGNLQYVRDLPPAVAQVRATRLWLADDIRPFAKVYKARRTARKRRQAKAAKKLAKAI
jgi:hypothetical protein